jgi:hypothetical protein
MTKEKDPKPNHLFVDVITTSGTWPEDGFDEVPLNQPVKVELKHASDKLKITDTNNWEATVTGRKTPLNIEQSYAENGLSGHVDLHWGPREGGGGSRS